MWHQFTAYYLSFKKFQKETHGSVERCQITVISEVNGCFLRLKGGMNNAVVRSTAGYNGGKLDCSCDCKEQNYKVEESFMECRIFW